eukprot:scaffold150263_cov76-Attheya_sp.AAC.1
MSLPCEKSLVLWGNFIAQGQQWTNRTPWCAALSRVICACDELSPSDHVTVSPDRDTLMFTLVDC